MEANRLAREEAQKAEEAKAQMEANRLAREEAQKANEADLAQSQAEAKDVAQAAQKQLTASDYLYSPTFKVIDASYDQMIALMDYMKSAKISVESIAKEKREK
jgi:multidrug resistance efflux pump